MSSPVPVHDPSEIGVAAATVRDFDAIYAEYFQFVWRCLRGLGIADAGLDDAAQDVFVVVHRRLVDFRGSSSVRTWLYGIVRNVASNHRRSALRKGISTPLEPDLPSTGPGPIEQAQDAEAARFVRRFLDGLDVSGRDVFLLALLEEMSMPEVAETLAIPLNTAYTRLRRARAAFHAAMSKEARR